MKKTYKVICTKPELSDEMYIDIAPTEGIIHDQIYFSRIQLHKQRESTPLRRIGGQIYLHDNDGSVTIEFPRSKKEFAAQDNDSLDATLEKKILRRYQQMRMACMDCTLFIYSMDEMLEAMEGKHEPAQNHSYKEKHQQQIRPQTPQEERHIEQAREFASIQEHRIIAELKRAEETVPAWLRFQKEYSGD